MINIANFYRGIDKNAFLKKNELSTLTHVSSGVHLLPRHWSQS